MKKKFTRIFGVGVIVTVLLSLLVPAAPAGAGTLSFTNDTSVPSTTSERLANGVGIVDIAINGDTIYAAGGDILNSPSHWPGSILGK